MSKIKRNILPRRKWPLVVLAVIIFLLTVATFNAVGKVVDKMLGINPDLNRPQDSTVSKWARVLIIGFASLFGLFAGLALVPWVPVIGVILVIVSAVWLFSTFIEIKSLLPKGKG